MISRMEMMGIMGILVEISQEGCGIIGKNTCPMFEKNICIMFPCFRDVSPC